MNSTEKLFLEAKRRGLTLTRMGEWLNVAPLSRLTPAFKKKLKANRVALLELIDERALQHTARQALNGEFDSACPALINTICRDLLFSQSPVAAEAINYLSSLHAATPEGSDE